MSIASTSDLLTSHGCRVRTIASADGAIWLSVTGATKEELERMLPAGFTIIKNAAEGALMVVPATVDQSV